MKKWKQRLFLIAAIVTKIIDLLRADDRDSIKQAKVKEYQRQIDQMVYKLYGLTGEGIRIVERDK